jgi:hypothetical protein
MSVGTERWECGKRIFDKIIRNGRVFEHSKVQRSQNNTLLYTIRQSAIV